MQANLDNISRGSIFYEKSDGSYIVVFPDINNLTVCGETFDDAMSAAQNALAEYVYSAYKTGEEILAPYISYDAEEDFLKMQEQEDVVNYEIHPIQLTNILQYVKMN